MGRAIRPLLINIRARMSECVNGMVVCVWVCVHPWGVLLWQSYTFGCCHRIKYTLYMCCTAGSITAYTTHATCHAVCVCVCVPPCHTLCALRDLRNCSTKTTMRASERADDEARRFRSRHCVTAAAIPVGQCRAHMVRACATTRRSAPRAIIITTHKPTVRAVHLPQFNRFAERRSGVNTGQLDVLAGTLGCIAVYLG